VKKLIFRTLLILISIILMFQVEVLAAVIVSTDKEVESGSGNVTISVTSKQALGAYELKLTDTAGLELISSAGGEISPDKKTITGSSSSGITNLGTYTFKVPTVTVNKTYNVKFLISKMETVDLNEIANETNTATITVKAPVVTPPSEPETPTPPPTTTVTKSSNAKLNTFGIKPADYDFSGFSKDKNKEDWNASVPNNVTEVTIYATAQHSNATVEGTGKVQLKEGNNTFEVKVTAEDGKTTKTYKLTINRKAAEEEPNESSENRLKNLGLKPEEYDFTGFKSDITQYSAEVPNEIEEIEVYATAVDSKAQINGIGMITLKEGENELKIEVIAENGDKKTYTLTVTRKAAETIIEPTEEKFGLSKLTIAGLNLSPKFDVETYEYTLNLSQDLTSLDITTKANDENATIEIVGNENLKQGENVITILVKNATTEKIATYQIIVNKNVVVEEVTMSWLKPSTWGKEEIIKIAIIVVLIILIISAIILKINISKENTKTREVALPGAEELDKAIAEHQELVDEPNKMDENLEDNSVKQNYIEEIAKDRFAVNEFEEKTKRRGRHF